MIRVKRGQFVVGSFFASDNTCLICAHGYQSSCQHREFVGGAQAPMLRVPLADGTLVATPGMPSDDLVPSLLATSDVLGTGWFAAAAANVQRGSTVAEPVQCDYEFWEADHFNRADYPKLHFVENRYAGDPTNWWIPNRACVEAMLRSAGFEIVAHPEDEVFICRRVDTRGAGAVYPARKAA